MIWSFFQNNGGQESGFHDAGVETFTGNLERYLAREIIQNSLDARDDQKKPVLVKFELLQIPASDIPDLKGLASTLHRCADYWPRDAKARDFFERAELLARAKKIVALKVGDYNTRGVTGSDKNREDSWYSLIRCSGASPKWAGEGGSFGIGKYAPFAASRMRAVLYSTLTDQRQYAFQGVARLVSHDLPKGRGIAQHIGYLGEDDGSSVRQKKSIPPHFVRAKPGTDLIILGYDGDGPWEKDLVFSILENFWPAIHFGDLEVQVAGTRINKKNLERLLTDYGNDGEFTAHLYYRAFTDPTAKHFKNSLPTLKVAEVRLLAGEQGLPKRVAMVRRTGMVIYPQQFRSPVSYCGVFLCKNETGNRLLREMEPPSHDNWDPNRPEKNTHRKTFLEFTSFIRDCVQNLAPADNEKVLTIPELSQYLPDDDESMDESFDGTDFSKRESFQRQPEIKKISGHKVDRLRRPVQPDVNRPGEEELETNGQDGNKGGGKGTGNRGKPDGGGMGNDMNEKTNVKLAIPIRGRVFAKDLSNGVYKVIVQPFGPIKCEVLLSLKAYGDDATSSVVRISAARDQDGKPLPMVRPGIFGPVKFRGTTRLIVEATLAEPRKLAMEVEAYEAES